MRFDSPCDILIGQAPDNPATSNLAYALIRSKAAALNTLVLHDLASDTDIALDAVSWSDSEVCFSIAQNEQTTTIAYNLDSHSVRVRT
jgi:hypothetical protein